MVWQLNPIIDRIIHESELIDLPQHIVRHIRTRAEYISASRYYVLGADGDSFMNHSDRPSLFDNKTTMLAARDLDPGDELTCDYRLVTVANFNPDVELRDENGIPTGTRKNGNSKRMPPPRAFKGPGLWHRN